MAALSPVLWIVDPLVHQNCHVNFILALMGPLLHDKQSVITQLVRKFHARF